MFSIQLVEVSVNPVVVLLLMLGTVLRALVPPDEAESPTGGDAVGRRPCIELRRNGRVEARLLPGPAVAVGRAADNDILVEDRGVSQHHVLLHVTSCGSVGIEDLGSTNGTFVDGQRVHTLRWVGADAEVRFGRAEIELRFNRKPVPARRDMASNRRTHRRPRARETWRT